MSKLTILRGVSGSGKSTWAEQQNAVVVSRDKIRLAVYGSDGPDYYNADKDVLSQREQTVTLAEHGMIDHLLRNGSDVIVDNTNIEWKYVNGYVKRARKLGAEVEIKVFDVPLATALGRNQMRAYGGGRNVPEDVIRKQHQRFQGNKTKELDPVFVPEPYTGTPGMPQAVLADVDGTLAHMKDRGPFDWKRVGEDEVDEIIAELVRLLDLDYLIVVMSGRDSACRDETEAWLRKHNISFDALFMRPEGDMRPDNIVKAELFDTHVRDNYDVQFVLDDRDQVVDMWRRMGLTCLQVAEGNF